MCVYIYVCVYIYMYVYVCVTKQYIASSFLYVSYFTLNMYPLLRDNSL